MAKPDSGAERLRLAEDAQRRRNWKRWGPYLAERQWGTVREDYSADGSCWSYFPHDHARSRAYRWGEDGLLGITDRECRLCFALALWNGRDPILKERLFGLTNSEGNHGEDAKECWFYLDSTPTHSYMKALYKYPQAEFPYQQLVRENARRSREQPEFELEDTGVFDDDRYFDVMAEYAKASPDDICIRLSVSNRGPEEATLHLLPTLWFRNTWAWGCLHEGCWPRPWIVPAGPAAVCTHHATLPRMRLEVEPLNGSLPPLLFTDNATNNRRLYGACDRPRAVKDAFHDFLIFGRADALKSASEGTKVAAWYRLSLAAGATVTLRLRLAAESEAAADAFGPAFDHTFEQRIAEADAFYASIVPASLPEEHRRVVRQACAGLLWSKQFYHYVVLDWLDGDPNLPPPPESRKRGRNSDWRHLFNRDVLSMPDKWEYPWYAAWDHAFHMLPLAHLDPGSAKDQLLLFLREWYMHPNGQIPAYEFNLSDVNPPVQAWACWRVYKLTGQRGARDRLFLARAFQKLMLNFTWWVNRKDVTGRHIFAGGFLGLDNIGVFDRSQPLPGGALLEQADGTAWVAFYCATMLSMALELASADRAYEDVASKFFEHFVHIADAINTLGGEGLWDDNDGFYYDQLRIDGHSTPLRLRSLVGLIPLLAVEVLDDDAVGRLPGFSKRMNWFLENRRDLARHISYMACRTGGGRRLLAIPSRERLVRVLRYVLDEKEFLSPYGIRSLSAAYRDAPFIFRADSTEHRVVYEPGESRSGMFGGNSNWRGPVWFPINFLLVEALERYDHFYGDTLRVECPVGTGQRMTLAEVSHMLSERLCSLFLPDTRGQRPCLGGDRRWLDPHWRNLLLFHEYFHGDTGRGLGASHQTGWTALVMKLMPF